MQDDSASPEDAEFGFLDEFDDEERADSDRDPRAWRMAGLAAATCLAAIAVAIVLLRIGGGSGHQRDVSLPIDTGGPTSHALISPPVASDSDGGFPTTSLHPIRTLHTSARPTRTATTSAALSTSARATPSSSTPRPTSTAPSSTPAPPSSSTPAPVVQVSKGGRDFRCNNCYFLAVTLANLPGGHRVVCEDQDPRHHRTRIFGEYDYDSTGAPGCSFDRTGYSVWVVVDASYQSNTITW